MLVTYRNFSSSQQQQKRLRHGSHQLCHVEQFGTKLVRREHARVGASVPHCKHKEEAKIHQSYRHSVIINSTTLYMSLYLATTSRHAVHTTQRSSWTRG